MKDIIPLPTYNERNNIRKITSDIFENAPSVEVWVIDDSSPDGTADEVKDMMKKFSNLKLVSRESKKGLGAAYKYAMALALQEDDVRSVITMDADGSHDPSYIPDMLTAIEDHDLIIGSRYINGGGVPEWEVWRRLLSWFGNFYAKALVGLPVRDLTAGFTCTRQSILRKIDWTTIGSEGYAFLMEFKFQAYRTGARIKEIPIVFI